AGLTKNGTGTLTILTKNSYTGPTHVNGGTLLVTGSLSGSTVAVENGAILGGSGTITTNNQPFVIEAGGRLSPGAEVGNLTVNTGSATLDLSAALSSPQNGTLLFALDLPEASDKITLAGGSLNIGTGLLRFEDFAFTTLSGFSPGTYTLIETGLPILGSLDANAANLSGILSGQSATLSLGDGGSDLVLTVVPEPGMAALLTGGLGMLLGLRRRRR
ncbi:MAG: autotransporter-associated beta strand repeat-containing protein, partial [Verrucomicrobiota bacterium]